MKTVTDLLPSFEIASPSPGWPGTCYVDQAWPQLIGPSASASIAEIKCRCYQAWLKIKDLLKSKPKLNDLKGF